MIMLKPMAIAIATIPEIVFIRSLFFTNLKLRITKMLKKEEKTSGTIGKSRYAMAP
ncbi:hypothetical protein SDC9_212319 [bioreactor metagenome]|uniref:Uncharacterized protein n=1 Tax=bioreactor metagenome TaxID=1076179 RepID=A0A645JYG6_9ZZZZ